ncbi:hypothetical protein K493DRAFT_339589 [Basidiobolus meristosporus CBS 931.73]|uniref:RNA polymerase II-associated protein 1 C-terminal domain-containing protein n=1 Tax=Basidiobolus meristosporus CBS 931.73 TaxID=1314790 RepID=A0A1Y1Y046_9FUNG|nr:hypothetical protein K493DRAFT_339589 [Basidiobolus meristosporus CBS 931.73]|eukprot:ORX91086.1 hypothetical protein K493DRAFT_339589 [Basidiobolus meristosporus CBS 931.73]
MQHIRSKCVEEGEEDLLQLQEDFLFGAHPPAATVKRVSKPPSIGSSKVKQEAIEPVEEEELSDSDLPPPLIEKESKAPLPRERPSDLVVEPESQQAAIKPDRIALDSSNLPPPVKNPAEQTKKKSLFASRLNRSSPSSSASLQPPSVKNNFSFGVGLLGEVKEKESTTFEKVNATPAFPTGFPQPVHRSQFKRTVKKNVEVSRNPIEPEISNVLFRQIHEENVDTLSKMTEDEILEAQAELMRQLDPELIKKLRNRQPLSQREVDPINESAVKEKADPLAAEKEHQTSLPDEMDIVQMKEKYFPNVQAEPEKLKWMLDEATLSSTTAPSTTKVDHPANKVRFDFRGNQLEENENIPTYMGLHHHGDEPDRPGYTLGELLHLMRSAVSSQRIISLNILGKIIGNLKDGQFGSDIQKLVLDYLMKESAAVYIRAAIDDVNETAMIAALNTMSVWIGNVTEETIWDDVILLPKGTIFVPRTDSPSIATPRKNRLGFDVDEDGEDNDAENENTIQGHAKLASKDIIKGLLAMNLLPRLRYLLDYSRLPQPSISQIFRILIQISQHSVESSRAVFDCPDMVDCIRGYISRQWPPSPTNTNERYNQLPNALAVKLMRIWAQSNRSIAKELIDKELVNSLLRFMAVDPDILPKEDQVLGYQLQLETLKLWNILSTYGFYCHILGDFHQEFVKYVSSISQLQPWSQTDIISRLRSKKVVLFFRLLENLTYAAVDTHSTEPEHAVCWPHISLFSSYAVLIFTQVSQALDDQSSFKGDRTLCELTISSIGQYLSGWLRYVDNNNATDLPQALELRNQLKLDSWITSKTLETSITRITSLIGEISKVDKTKESHGIPGLYLTSRMKTAELMFELSAACNYVSAYLDLVAKMKKFVSDFYELGQALLTSPSLLSLVDYLCINFQPETEWMSQIARGHYLAIYSWVNLFNKICDTCKPKEEVPNGLDPAFVSYYAATIVLATRPLAGEEAIAESMIFTALRPRNIHKLLRDIDDPALSLPDDLREILEPFLNSHLGKEEDIGQSRAVSYHLLKQTRSLFFKRAPQLNRASFSQWALSPIDDVVKITKETEEVEEICGFSVFDIITNTLKYAKLVNHVAARSGFNNRVNCLTGVRKIMKVFGINYRVNGEDLFLMDSVEAALNSLYNYYVEEFVKLGDKTAFDLEEANDSNVPFYQFYQDFINLYVSVSFGNQVFARMVLPPLAMTYPSEYRLALWSEYFEMLSTFRNSIEDTPAPNGLSVYFYPIERNFTLLQLYAKALLMRKVTRKHTPFLYWIAVHHLNRNMLARIRNMANDESSEPLLAMMHNLIKSKLDHETCTDLTHYHNSEETFRSPDTYEPSPDSQSIQLWLSKGQHP